MIEIGKTAFYLSYGVEKKAKIVDISRNGAIVFFDRGKWVHATSILKVE